MEEKISRIVDLVLDHTQVTGVEDPEFEVWDYDSLTEEIKKVLKN